MNDFDWKSNLLSDLDYAWRMSELSFHEFLAELFDALRLFIAGYRGGVMSYDQEKRQAHKGPGPK